MTRFSTLLVLAACLFYSAAALAQAPTGMNYQAVARNSSGKEMGNKSVAVRISILNGSASGTADYVEKHSVSTNQFGLFSLVIGSGSAQTGTFGGINWSGGVKFLKVELDTNNGNSFTTMSNQQLMSVPYALYAQNVAGGGSGSGVNGSGTTDLVARWVSGSAIGNSTIYDNGTLTAIGTTSPGSTNRFTVSSTLQNSGYFTTNNTNAASAGVRGDYTGTTAVDAAGVFGLSTPAEGNGIGGSFQGGWTGTLGQSLNGTDSNYFGTYGFSATANSNAKGVFIGARGRAQGTKGVHYGGYFQGFGDSNAMAVIGGSSVTTHSTLNASTQVGNPAAYFICNDGQGVFGETNGSFNFGSSSTKVSTGVTGWGHDASGMFNIGMVAYGENGDNNSTGIEMYGDEGTATSNYVLGFVASVTGTGSTATYAGYMDGDAHVNGTLSKNGGSFKIDHPQDPLNKFLIHSFVESPDMMNIYNGNITTDANGMAVVELPAYFMAENKDFRYQLTVIGTFAQAIVAEEVANNKFTIKTNQPNVKVSWQVTGIRQDAWANANRIQPEVEKKGAEKGRYLNPELFGKKKSEGISALMRSYNFEYKNKSNEGRFPLLTQMPKALAPVVAPRF